MSTPIFGKPRNGSLWNLLRRALIAILRQGDVFLSQTALQRLPIKFNAVLPTDMRARDERYDAKDVLAKAGVRLGPAVYGDPIFMEVRLPVGWRIESTNEHMKFNLVDSKGRLRAMIIYHNVIGNRWAFLNVEPRFGVRIVKDGTPENAAVAGVTDGNSHILFTTRPIRFGKKGRYKAEEKAQRLAEAWLNKRYPEWKNPAAYWD